MNNSQIKRILQALVFLIPFLVIVFLAIFAISKNGCTVDISGKKENDIIADDVLVPGSDTIDVKDTYEEDVLHTEENIENADENIESNGENTESNDENAEKADVPADTGILSGEAENPDEEKLTFVLLGLRAIPKEPKIISFAAAGDILVHTNVYKYASQLAAGTDAEYDFKPMFRNIKDIISSADIAFVNQETPCAGKDRGYSGYPMFNTPDEIADAVLDTGFDVVSIANNHMLDKGSTGLSRTIDFWNSKNVLLLGGFKNRDDYNTIRVLDHDGVKIAFLSYTYGTNGITLPASSEMVIPLENYNEIDRQTKEARAMADVVIVSMHWGYEDWFKPTDNQKNLARMMADNGVDVIIGHHSHTLQPIEWIDRPDGKRTLCVYSLGNLISTMMYSRNMLGAILTFDIKETDDGFVIENPEMIPYMNYYKPGFAEPTLYLYKDFSDEMLNNHGCRRYDSYISRKYLNKIITDTIDKQFIKDEYCLSLYPVDEAVSANPS